MGRELTTGDIARRNGIDRKTAYRWMRAIHEEHGPTVVSRRGKRGVYVTTEDAFTRIAVLGSARDLKNEDRIARLEQRLEEAERRADHLAADIAALYQLVGRMKK